MGMDQKIGGIGRDQRGIIAGGDVKDVELITGDVSVSYNLIEKGASLIIQQLEALSPAEESERSEDVSSRRLARAVKAKVKSLQRLVQKTDTERLNLNPYKSLNFYQLEDAPFFYGRTRAIRELLDQIHKSRLTILYADSGSGKSSLLQAGIQARLLAAGHLPINIRLRGQEQVSQAIKRALIPELAAELTNEPLDKLLTNANRMLGHSNLYLFLDQFEEFFLRTSSEHQRAFVNELNSCLDQSELDARWVISLRGEYLYRLHIFGSRARANEYYLPPFSEGEARQVIEEPARRRETEYEPRLVDAILTDLAQQAEAPAEGYVPPQVQLVCHTLFKQFTSQYSQRTITFPAYERAGKVKGILESHLKRTIDRLPDRLGQKIARQVLVALVSFSSEGQFQRDARTRADLIDEIQTRIRQASPDNIRDVLDFLVDNYLLRIEHDLDLGDLYEITHDYLVVEISQEIELDPDTRQRKRAEYMLHTEVDAYLSSGKKTLIAADKLTLIEPYLEQMALDTDASNLLKASRRAIYEAEEKEKRQQRVIRASGSLAGLFVIVAIIAGVAAFLATREANQLNSDVSAVRATATIESAIFGARQATSAADMAEATAQLATAEVQQTQAAATVFVSNRLRETAVAARELAETEGTIVAQAVVTAEANVVIAESTLVSVEERSALAAQQLALLFQHDGIVPVGLAPDGLAWDGRLLWVANGNDDSVMGINPATGRIVRTFSVGNGPLNLLWDGSGLWVTHWLSDSVVRYDVADGTSQIQASVDSPIALAWDGTYVWVASRKNNVVVQLDPESGERRQTIHVGNSPEALAWDGASLWVANTEDDTVMRIKPEDGTIIDQVNVGDGPEALAWDGSSMWVANLYENSLTQIMLGPDAVVEDTNTFLVGGGPRALFWDGASLWVAYVSDDSVGQLDPATGETALTVPIGAGPVNLISDGTHIWTSNYQSNTVQRINLEDYAVQQTVSVFESPAAITWDGNNLWAVGKTGISDSGVIAKLDPATGERTAFFGAGYNLFASTWDGSSLWVANRGEDSILEVDPDTNDIVNTIEVGDSPKALLWDGAFLWVANNGDDTIMQLENGEIISTIPVGDAPENLSWDGTNIWTANFGDDTLTKVDRESGEVVRIFAVCDGPVALAWETSHIWTICWNDSMLMQIDRVSGAVLATVPVGRYPAALLWDGISIWVANRGEDTGFQTLPDSTVLQIDPLSATVVRSVQVGQAPFALTLVDEQLWVVNGFEGTLMEINAHSLGLDLLARRQLSE